MRNDPALAEHIRSLLQQFGWETGMKKLQAEIDATEHPGQKASLQLFAGWMAAERGASDEANQLFGASLQVDALAAWAHFGQAFLALRQHDHKRTHQLLEEAVRKADSEDRPLLAAVAHLRGANYFHDGDSERALQFLREALRSFGRDHYATGRVLDTFGMVYAGRDNFHAAAEFFKQAVLCKQKWDDQAGLALSFGNLGRLHLDWGYLDKAEGYFHQDLAIAKQSYDARSEAMMHDHLGQIALERGELAAGQGRLAEARKHWADAASWLDSSIQRSRAGGWTVSEAFARKDRAMLFLAEGKIPEAEVQVAEAQARFQSTGFSEGLAHVNRIRGMILRRQGAYDEASRALRSALAHFQQTRSPERVQIARTLWEIARTARDAKAPRPETTKEYVDALKAAETSRRAALVRQIGEELKDVDPEAYLSHMFYRVRGRDVQLDTDSLISGVREPLTVLFLDLKGSTNYAFEVDPEVVMMTFNQMMADMSAVLRNYQAMISGFRGDGFMAIFRGQNHATRAVEVGLDLFQELKDFNEPRDILRLKSLEVRIGISSGEAILGNVGTYDLMDYTALGTTANLGARLEAEAIPGCPCISLQTHNEVRDRFTYRDGCPRSKDLKGLGIQQFWDVVERAPAKRGPAM